MRTPFRLNKTIGEAYDMDLADALTTKKALASLGHLEPPDDGFDEYPDRPLIEAVKSFQRAEGLAEDGVIKPDGPTLARLNDALKTHPTSAAPAPGGETGLTSRLNSPAEPGAPMDRHLASLPARPGAAPPMDSKKSTPEGTQVAMAPAVALIPPLIGLAARTLLGPAARTAAGTAAAGAAGTLLGRMSKEDKNQTATERTDIAQTTPQLPGFEPPKMKLPDRMVNMPPKDLGPTTTIFPNPGDRQATIESFPDQSDELLQAIILENSRGGPETQEDTDYAIAAYDRAVKRWQVEGGHTHGGHTPDTGEYSKERYLKPEGDLRAARTDGTFVLKHGARETVDDIQTVDTLSDGKTLTARERRNDERIEKLKEVKKEHGSILRIPKSRGKRRKDWEREVDAMVEAHFRKKYGPPSDAK
ncbi:MAG: peptidoglycan-binding domain-containing protein [Alphaproteobacteria bacterium]|uniref:peptidoglycan-binding domain-containing protein n=1 Tax=Roseibium sp. TaxID=1936156 RepID=UPI0032957DE7